VQIIEGYMPEPGEKAEPIAMGRQTIWGGAGKTTQPRDVMQAAAKAARSEMLTRVRESKGPAAGARECWGRRPGGAVRQATVAVQEAAAAVQAWAATRAVTAIRTVGLVIRLVGARSSRAAIYLRQSRPCAALANAQHVVMVVATAVVMAARLTVVRHPHAQGAVNLIPCAPAST
jgi:ATP-dependent RNA helicase RhlE